jgi:uncharacterized protein YraI
MYRLGQSDLAGTLKKTMKNKIRNKASILILVVAIFSLALSACAPQATPAPTQDPSAIQTQAAQTVVADLTLNAPPTTEPPAPTEPAEPTPTEAAPPGPTPDPSIPVAVVPTPSPGEPSAVANYNTTIFSGPGENYVVYATFLGGRTAKVIGQSEDGLWWAISVPVAPDGSGWVNAAWVTVANTEGVAVLPTPPVPPTVEIVPPEPGDPQATALVNVYVRTGPATNFPAYGIATTNTTGRVLGISEDGQWWVVRINPEVVGAGYGWVMAEYTFAENVDGIQTIKTPTSGATYVPPPPPAGVPSATATDAVNLRSGPGTNYPVLVVAPAGAAGEVTGQSADGLWWQVAISTQYSTTGFGWVSASYVYVQNTDSVPVVDAPPAPPVVGPTPPTDTTGSCVVVSQSPVDGTAITIGAPFDTTWVLQNTSAERWDMSEVDLLFGGAVDNIYLHTGPDRYDLFATVEPGATYNFTVSMLAPFGPGVFGELWQVVLGSQPICEFYVYIEVP